MSVTPRIDMRPGPFQGDLVIDLLDEQGRPVEAGWLGVEGDLLAAIRPIPARLTLPATKVGETAVGMFLLQAPDDAEVAVVSIATDAVELQVEPARVPGVRDRRAYTASLTVPRSGDFSTTVRFTLRPAGGEPAVYSMDVFCRGLKADSP